jgi:hypothetical protein
MSIMTELTAKGKMEVGFNNTVIPPLTPIVIASLGVLIPLVLVAPSRLVLLGLIPALTLVVVVPVYFWNYSMGGSDFPYSSVRNFDIVE